MKKTGITLAVLILLAVGAYLFIRYSLLRSPDFKPDLTKARSALDLRPALIAKLRQMMKDGSKGLYILSIEDINADISNAAVDLINVTVSVDSSVLQQMDIDRKAPDDVYNISFNKLRIEGLGLAELINRKHIDLEQIIINQPSMSLYRTERTYNAAKREADTAINLYERLTKHASHIGVKNILIDHGSFNSFHLSQRNKTTRFENISVNMNGLLIDSTTQHDRNRFFFSENTFISCGALERRTADSLYLFKVDSISLEAKEHRLTAFKLALVPRAGKAGFQQRLTYRGDRFDIAIPKLVLTNMKWWRLFNNGSVDCDALDIYGGHLYDFVNDSLPPKPKIKINNFPYQTLRQLSLPLNIKKVNVRNFNISYSEYYPPSGREGTLYFDNVNGQINNLINKPRYIAAGMWCTVNVTAAFMHKIPVRIRMGFDMNRYKTGVFTASIKSGTIDGSVVNPVTEPLSFFTVKRGVIDSISVNMNGNNARVNATVKILYHDLHITTLKKQKQEPGDLKKKRLLNFFANTFIIKNDNPGKNDEPRIPYVEVDRATSGSFFNFSWRAIRLGVFKTVGIPETFAPK